MCVHMRAYIAMEAICFVFSFWTNLPTPPFLYIRAGAHGSYHGKQHLGKDKIHVDKFGNPPPHQIFPLQLWLPTASQLRIECTCCMSPIVKKVSCPINASILHHFASIHSRFVMSLFVLVKHQHAATHLCVFISRKLEPRAC